MSWLGNESGGWWAETEMHRQSVMDREQHVDSFTAGRNKACVRNCKVNDSDIFPISRNIH